MTPFEIWWVGVPPFTLFYYWACGKMLRNHPHMNIPVVRGGASAFCGLLWPILLVLDIIPATARWLGEVATSLYNDCWVGDMPLRQWWRETSFGVTVREEE